MKAGQNKKTVRVEFVMSEQDAELVKGRMAELGITNLSAYLRKMAVDGYIIHLDMCASFVSVPITGTSMQSGPMNPAAFTPPMWRICVPGWTASGMAWISCCGDLRTFRKQEETPLLSVVRHGRIFIGNKLPYRKEAGVCV